MVQTLKKIGEQRYRESFGRHFEEFEIGDVYEHRPGRTITETDNTWFTLLTMNTHPMHFDAEYAKASEFGRCIVCSPFTVALMVGMSVTDVSQKAIANLGWSDIKLVHPLFAGDTLYAELRGHRQARVEIAPGRRPRLGEDDRHQPGRHGGLHLRPHDADRQARPQRRRQGQLLMEPAMDSNQQEFVDAVETWVEKELQAGRARARQRRRVPARDRRADEGARALRRDHRRGLRRPRPVGVDLCADRHQGRVGLDGAVGHLQFAPDHGLGDRAQRHRGAEAQVPAEDGERRVPRQHRPDRAERRLRPAGDPHRSPGATATTTSSTAARPGSPTACTATARCCW